MKQISERARTTLAKVMVALDERTSDDDAQQASASLRPPPALIACPARRGTNDLARALATQISALSDLALELGVVLRPNSAPEGPAAVAIWLFDGSVDSLPGGFDVGELSPNSPVKVLQSFPQELVLAGRSTVLIKGIAAKLKIKWSLASEWAPIARRTLAPPRSRRFRRLRRLAAAPRIGAGWVGARMGAALAVAPKPLRSTIARAALRVSRMRRRTPRAAPPGAD